jgi:hypothetical protein
VTALAVGSLGTAASAASGYLNDPDASLEREQSNAAISEYAATQGMVLLENNKFETKR